MVTGPYGINNDGELIIKSGKIIGVNYAGINNKNGLILGDKDGNIEYYPVVNGKSEGINNTGTFNFYDGIIEGNEASSIKGVIASETEEDSLLVIHKGEYTFNNKTENGYNVAPGREISVLDQVNVAYVESKDKNYTSLQKALADTETSDTIKIVHDVSINGAVESLVIPENKNITLNLNGFNVVAGNNNTIINNGTFKIIDSTSHEDESGKIIEGKFISGGNTILENNGTATIENGLYELSIGGSSSDYYNMFVNTGTLEINGEATYETKGYYSRAIYNSTGDVLIKNGLIKMYDSGNDAIYNNAGTINIENITIKGNINNNNAGTINIKGGTINGKIINNGTETINIEMAMVNGNGSASYSDNYNVWNKGTGKIIIKDGTIKGTVKNDGTGTINIIGGTIRNGCNNTAVHNASNGVINITGGTISGQTAVQNSNSGTININGTSLSEENPIQIIANEGGSRYGISNSGTVNIKGYVNIDATYGIGSSSYSNIGIVNIGDPNDITNNVKISSDNYGVYDALRTGAINYYGGTITAPTAITGIIYNIPEGYNILKSIDESNNEVYEIGRIQDIVSVGDKIYNTLQEAITNNDSGTIKLLKDIVYSTQEKVIIENNKDFILDLNGHSIKLHNNEEFIKNYGQFKIIDNTEEKNGNIYGSAREVIKNEGNFEMCGGIITIEQENENKIIYNTQGGTVKVTGGTLYAKHSGNNKRGYIIYSDNSNDIEILGGTFCLNGSPTAWWNHSYFYAIYTEVENTTINVRGGNFKHEGTDAEYTYMIAMKSVGTVNVSGNVTSNNSYGINMEKSGIVNISDEANLNNKNNSIDLTGDASGEVNISGGTVNGIYDRGVEVTVTLTGGTLTGTINYCKTVDIYEGVNCSSEITRCKNVNVYQGATVTSSISYCGSVNINNATINGNIFMNYGTLNMTGGSITGTNYGIGLNSDATATITGGTINATAGPGILISTKTGTLNLGEDTGGYPSTEVPTITGSTYGVKNDGGTFNFYDGILTGGTEAIIGTVTKTPDSFKVLYSEGGKVAILGIEATFEQVAKVNGVYYNDLESAMNSAININGKVELCKDITTGSSITIPAGKTVTIDMQGYSINGYTETEALFINNGTLIIQDSTNEGTNESKVKSHTGTVIVNNGTLTLGVDDGIVYTNSPNVIGKTIAIENNGTFNFFDGQIGIFDLVGDILNNEETINIPEGYKTIKLEGSNIYTLVEKTDTDTNS